MTKETQTAVNTAKIDFITKVFDKHCKDQNGSINRMADSMEKTNEVIIGLDKNNQVGHSQIVEDYRKGLERVYEKIDQQLGKSITKIQAIGFAILASVVSALLIYVITGK